MNTIIVKRIYSSLVILPALLTQVVSAQNSGAPTWTSIMQSGQEVEYALYTQSPHTNTETFSSAAPWNGSDTGVTTSPRPPVTFNFSDFSYGGTLSNRGVCSAASGNLNNTNWSNWSAVMYPAWPTVNYNPSEFPVTGSFTYAPPSEYNTSRVESGVKGLEFEASFNGGSSGTSASNALDVVYVTDNPCAAGDNEYGFRWDTAQEGASGGPVLLFYYSALTNCPPASPTGPYCYTTTDYTTKETQTSGSQISITGLSANTAYVVHAYLVTDPDAGMAHHSGRMFRVEVLDSGDSFVTCAVNGGSSGNCTYDLPIDPSLVWSAFEPLLYGENDVNVIAGILVAGNPTNLTGTPGFEIEYVKVGK